MVAALMLALIGCGHSSQVLRYRLSVEVETSQGLRTGSSVIEVRGFKNPDWLTPEGRGTRSSFRGEAVGVDLPGGQTLFALLYGGGTDAAEFPWLAFRDRLKGSKDWLESMERMRGWQGEIVLMQPTQTINSKEVSGLPLLVTFRDIKDPASVEEVDPVNLAANFGPGVKLRRVTIQITDDPVTTGIEKRLGWLPTYYDRRLDGTRDGILAPLHSSINGINANYFSARNGLSPFGDRR